MHWAAKKTILLGLALFTIGCAISCAVNGLVALVAGRVINGLGGKEFKNTWAADTGETSKMPMIPGYISDIIQANYRSSYHNVLLT